MSLREQAAADLLTILEDSDGGFGWPITVTDPDGATLEMVGFSSDISQSIDPDTGQTISGRAVTVGLSISRLLAAGMKTPRAVSDSTRSPWVVEFADVLGRSQRFSVIESNPDSTIGLVTCSLAEYRL